jgi:ABC-2 type transport system permease protein
MNTKKVFLVFRKDWREISRNWQVLMPIIILPLIISTFLPIVLSIPGSSATDEFQGLDMLTKNMPADVRQLLAGLTSNQAAFYVVTMYLLAPLFLIIPLMTSSVISSDSFAGEKERKTIEALLATPISDGELFLGKVLVSFIPSTIITLAAFGVYSAIVDYYSLSQFGMIILPNVSWLVMILCLAPALSLASIGLSVIISAKVKGFREAQQLSAILIVPIIAMVFSQISGAIIFGPLVVGVMAAAFVLADFAIFYVGVKRFRREEILSRM